MMGLALIACTWLLFIPSIQAQQFPVRFYANETGLANLAVTAVTQDKKGYLWVGTENGVYRFDGSHFQRFGTEDGLRQFYVSALQPDDDGGIWVGTTEHLFHFSGQYLVEIKDANQPLSIWQGQNLSKLPDGRILAMVKREPYLFQKNGKDQWSGKPLLATIAAAERSSIGGLHSLFADSSNNIWMGCGKAVCQWSSGNITVWNASRGVPEDIWKSILKDRHGSIWIRSAYRIVEISPAASIAVDRSPSTPREEREHLFLPLAEDADGRILQSSDTSLLRWDGQQWQIFKRDNGIPGEGLSSLYVDREGNVWMGAGGLGLMQWLGYPYLENWTFAQGLKNETVWSFLSDHHTGMYLGTDSGLQKLHNNTISDVDPHELGKTEIASLADGGNGNLWVGTMGGTGILRLDEMQGKITQATKTALVFHILHDTAGQTWFTTMQGLYALRSSNTTGVPEPVIETRHLLGDQDVPTPNACEGSSHTIWVLSDLGPLRMHDGAWDKPEVKNASNPPRFSQIACSPDGTVWLGGETPGLWQASPTNSILMAKRIPMPDDLRDARIVALLMDHRGWLWVGTDMGVAVLDHGRWSLLRQDNGLVWPDVSQAGLYEDIDGSVWIGTSKGISHVIAPTSLFKPAILSAEVVAIERGEKSLSTHDLIALPWSKSPLTFYLAALSYKDHAHQRLLYRLIGFDETWQTAEGDKVQFTALPGGSYSFELKAQDPYSNKASPVTTVSFTVRPPWWRRLDVQVAEIVALFLLIAGIIRLWLHRLLTQRRKLESMVAERTYALEEEKRLLTQAKLSLQQMATTDSLTKLKNRHAILEILDLEISRATSNQQDLVVVLIDIDHFKQINDTYGHLAGDEVLRSVSQTLDGLVRSSDSLGRYGGEEFLLIMPGIPIHMAQGRLDDLHRQITSSVVLVEDVSIHVTMSFGAAALRPLQQVESKELLHQADTALYLAKETGRNRIVWTSYPSGN